MKVKLIVAAVVILLVIGGVSIFAGKKGSNIASDSEKKSLIGSVEDILASTVGYTCDFTDDTGRISKTYIKNNAVRGDYTGKTAQEAQSFILKDNMMYVWSVDTAFMMEIPKDSMNPSGTPEGSMSKDDIVKNIDKFKESCKPGGVPADAFTPPSNVKFTNMTELMKKTTTSMAPSKGMTEDDVKKMMEQYQKASEDQ